MSSADPRKRPASASSPALRTQQMHHNFAPSPLSPDPFLKWNTTASDTAYHDLTNPYNMNNFNANNLQQAQRQAMPPPSSTQLARRPVNRQLMSTGQHSLDNPWGSFGEDGLLNGNSNPLEDHDNIERLEERAAAAKRDAQAKRKQIPPFVQKLSSFLDESKNTELIRWSDRGDSFIVLDEDEFARTLIPELFKHNNYASFVRQLNMYGFHKRVGLSDNSMKASERKNKSPSEYYNPYFKRNHPNLLWLINKPKGGSAQKKGKTRSRTEEGGDADSDEDGREGADENYGQGYGQGSLTGAGRAISAAPESGPLQKRELALVREQLQDLQKSQGAISNAITRLRKDHNQLYQQAVAFQTLHERHENSINAILTFLATVYNRSLDGQNGQDLARLFANGIPTDQQHRGDVVDMGDVNSQQQDDSDNVSPLRRQRLLMAPPNNLDNSRIRSASPAITASNPVQQVSSQMQASARPAIEELFDSPVTTPPVKPEPVQTPQADILSLIHSTNANAGDAGMGFPDVLSHYETANGNSPLTTEQRNSMLTLMANRTSTPGSNNALVSPTPPPAPDLAAMDRTANEIDHLTRMQREQQDKIQRLKDQIVPLSPSGAITGLADDQYFANPESFSPGGNANLDLDQFLDSGAYYTNGDQDFNYNFTAPDDNGFDFGMDGVDESGRIVESAGSSAPTTVNSAAESPEDLAAGDESRTSDQRSPKRQRKG